MLCVSGVTDVRETQHTHTRNNVFFTVVEYLEFLYESEDDDDDDDKNTSKKR